MRLMLRLFVAFCVATVLAQMIILAMAGARGNFKQDSFVKALALLNGIDISGDQLEKMLADYRREPAIRYEDIVSERAKSSLDLQMREDSVSRMQRDVSEKLLSLKTTEAAFGRRLEEFYSLIDREKKNLLSQSLIDVKSTIESLAPEQAKVQLLKIYTQGKKDEAVAILKAMPMDKRRKIVGEFQSEEEAEQINEIFMMMLQGEPVATLLDDARNSATAP